MKKLIKKIQQCIKHIKTMFYTKVLAVSLRKNTIGDKILNKIKYFWIERKLKKNRIKIHRDMINQQSKLPLKQQSIHIENARTFMTNLYRYVESNIDTKEFHINGGNSYDPNNQTYSIGFVWNSGHVFNLEFTNVYVENGYWLEFTFKIYRRWYEENGVYNGKMTYNERKELQPTGLLFYVNYVGDRFNIKSNYSNQSMESSDYGYATNLIAIELVKELEKPNR